MIDTNMKGASWIELKAKNYFIVQQDYNSKTKITSNCQLEVNVSYENIICHSPEGEWSKLAPIRILSFDIECAGYNLIFFKIYLFIKN